jgi:hypothetical protein
MTADPFASGTPRRSWPGITAGLLLFAAAGAAFWKTWQGAKPDESAATSRAAARRIAEVRYAIDSFLYGEAKLILDAAEQKDMAAVQQALDSLRACFKTCGEGVDGFADALTGWGMRSKIIYRKTVETVGAKTSTHGPPSRCGKNPASTSCPTHAGS